VSRAIVPLGESALLVTLGDRVSREIAARVHAATLALRAAAIPGVEEIVPAYASIGVYFDRARLSASEATHAIATVIAVMRDADVERAPARVIEIPTRYDGADLDDVARATGLTTGEVIARHAARTYTVYALGFAPGFAYLGDLDPALVLPRRATPRTRVPAGSVAIAAAQTAVYPAATPGGWHLIGTTSRTMFDARRDPPALLAAGDEVRFVPVTT
jgi:KipI family sensor histidine kinase inhibitor